MWCSGLPKQGIRARSLAGVVAAPCYPRIANWEGKPESATTGRRMGDFDHERKGYRAALVVHVIRPS